jgi:hypothetical protein
MKYWTMRMPDPMLLGLTFFEAVCRAMVSASLVNMPFFGNVDSVLTLRTQRFFSGMSAAALQGGLTFAIFAGARDPRARQAALPSQIPRRMPGRKGGVDENLLT